MSGCIFNSLAVLMNFNTSKNDISLTRYDIISVPSYAEGIYHTKRVYHPFRQERISLKKIFLPFLRMTSNSYKNDILLRNMIYGVAV